MKVIFINCPHCGKSFYCEELLVENELPLHCPGCDTYLDYSAYADQLGSRAISVLTRIRKPLTGKTVKDILYIPKKS